MRTDSLAVILSLAFLLGVGCSITKTVQLIPTAGGSPGRVEFESGLFAQSGEVRAVLADGTQLNGRWSTVDSGTSLGLMQINTPNGPITAQALAQTSSPRGVATLTGNEVTLLCVFSGTASSGAAVCADSRGIRYVGNW